MSKKSQHREITVNGRKYTLVLGKEHISNLVPYGLNPRFRVHWEKLGRPLTEDEIHDILRVEAKTARLREGAREHGGFLGDAPYVKRRQDRKSDVHEGSRRHEVAKELVAEGNKRFEYLQVYYIPDEMPLEDLQMYITDLQQGREPWEAYCEAGGYADFYKGGMSLDNIALKIGLGRTTIATRMHTYELCKDYVNYVHNLTGKTVDPPWSLMCEFFKKAGLQTDADKRKYVFNAIYLKVFKNTQDVRNLAKIVTSEDAYDYLQKNGLGDDAVKNAILLADKKEMLDVLESTSWFNLMSDLHKQLKDTKKSTSILRILREPSKEQKKAAGLATSLRDLLKSVCTMASLK